jgi:excisionase family DNA binding protein
MPKTTPPGRDESTTAPDTSAPTPPSVGGDVYTMAEAARLKGVSYHTVSRAVRREKLPAKRLGRMALIAADDLRAWRPMRERAPRKYRRREPNPEATPALLDLASGERVELARRLSTFYEVLHSAAIEQPLPDFLALLAERLATGLDLRRVAIWGVDSEHGKATRLAGYGPALSRFPADVALDELPVIRHALEAPAPYVIDNIADFELEHKEEVLNVVGAFVAPLRLGDQVLGVVVGDCNGEPLDLSTDELVLAQGLANQAAIALDRARLRAEKGSRAEQLVAILENVSEAVFACDGDGHLTVMNAAGRALLGIGDGTSSATMTWPRSSPWSSGASSMGDPYRRKRFR